MSKSITLITNCFVLEENADGPGFVAITLTPDSVKNIEAYLTAIADIKAKGLNPSVLDTHDIPNVMFIARKYDQLPLNPDEYMQLMFVDAYIQDLFDDLFIVDTHPATYSTLSDLEYQESVECTKLKVRHDNIIWVDTLEKYSGIKFESEAFGLSILEKIKAKLEMTEEVPTEDPQKNFLENPCKCPHCGGDDVEGGHVEVDAGGAWQSVSCNNCGATWNEVYKLIGFSELETND